MTGLYFYKLVTDDAAKLGNITKDCKLTINEIDHNFATLQSADISNVYVDEEKKHLVLTRNDGNTFVMDITKITEKPEFEASFDDMDGVLELTYDNNTYVFTDFITKKNLSKEILTKVYSDGTLKGVGTAATPLSLASVQKTGCYKPVIKYLDTTVNERLPFRHVAKGDRYVTREKVSDYGLLYNFHDAEHINKLLENSGWRIPTKADWDAMLNAMEPCGFKNHESTLSNVLLGKVAGSLLKSIDGWDKLHDHKVETPQTCNATDDIEYDVEDDNNGDKYLCHPHEKPMSSRGRDAFGMTVLPAGYAYCTSPISFNCFGHKTAFWTADKTDTTNVYTKVFEAKYSGVYQVAEGQDTMLSIRLVKDYDGTNHNEVENILGQNYRTVLLKSENNPNGYMIWTTQNLNIREQHMTSAILPNGTCGLPLPRVAYFINEWNGFGWDRVELEEGDSVTVLAVGHNRWNEHYRVINGVFENMTDYLIKAITEDISVDINKINNRLDVAETQINNNTTIIEINKQAFDTEHTRVNEEFEKVNGIVTANKELLDTYIDFNQEQISGITETLKEHEEAFNTYKEETEAAFNQYKADVETRFTTDEEQIAETAELLQLTIGMVEAFSGDTLNRFDKDEEAFDTYKKEAQEVFEKYQDEVDNRFNTDEQAFNEFKETTNTTLEEHEQAFKTEQERVNEEFEKVNARVDDEIKAREEAIENEADTRKNADDTLKEVHDQLVEEIENGNVGDKKIFTFSYDVESSTLTVTNANGGEEMNKQITINYGTLK